MIGIQLKSYSLLIGIILLIGLKTAHSQVTNLSPEDFKTINIGYNAQGDYTKSVILLHEIYNGIKIGKNFSIGEVCALRGSTGSNNRTNTALVNTSSGYNHVSGGMTGLNSDGKWKLKLVLFQGKKYLAVEVPYRADYHSAGFRFKGWTRSTGESMKWVAFENRGNPVNETVLTIIGDYNPNIVEYHDYSNSIFSGNMVVGSDQIDSNYKLSVNGNIRATEIKVEAQTADFVFEEDYQLKSLDEVEAFVKLNKHLPEIPSAKQMETDGVNVAQMNKLLLQKIEELTLYMIEMKKENSNMKKRLRILEENKQS